MLCGSILSSPIYRDVVLSSRLEMSKTWAKTSKLSLNYRQKKVSFSKKYFQNNIISDCIYCRGYEEFHQDNTNEEWTDLCLTRSFDDKFSLYVLEAYERGSYYVTKYFRKVPALINAQEIITHGNIVFDL